MTLRRKILIWIACLTFLIILFMSGTYYYLFSQQIHAQSSTEIREAFQLILDDITSRLNSLTETTQQFVHGTLSGPLYVIQLFYDQLSGTDQEWTVREVRRIATPLSNLAYEIGQFGNIIGAVEIAVYGHQHTLVAAYRQGDNGADTVGFYLPQVYEQELIPVQPGDDWFATLMDLEEIPHQPLPENLATAYDQKNPAEPVATLDRTGDKLILSFRIPVIQREEVSGLCLIRVALTQADAERYSRLTGTRVNLFTDATLSVGAFPAYDSLSEGILDQLEAVNPVAVPTPLPINFAESDVADQPYYQGTLVLRNAQQVLGAVTVHLSRQFEQASRRSFILVVVGITLVFALLTAGGASVLSTIIVRPIQHLTELLQRLTQGDLESITNMTTPATDRGETPASPTLPASRNELDQLFASFHNMVDYLREMTTIADHISRGEITHDIVPRSEKDILGQAFHRMTQYLNRIASVAQAVAEGDLRQDVTPQTQEDVLGQAFYRMSSLREIMGEIVNEAQRLEQMADELNQISGQMASDADQSSQRAHDVSSHSQQVNQNVNEVSTATSEMAASIREISRNAHDVAEVVNEAVKTAHSANEIIADLENRSQEIGNIIKVITTITQQTNLLALNATIEAARAGESGKGFAVVASEVKDLARETAQSAEDVTHRIQAIQASSKAATESIEKMSYDIERVDTFTNVIVSAVTEQAATTDVITRNLSEAAGGTEEMARAISDVANVSQNSSDIATRVKNSAAKQASVAEHLHQLVNKFKI